MAKRFRKVFLILDDANVFGKNNYFSTEIYRTFASADQVCKAKQEKANSDALMWHNHSNAIPQYKVHSFYLVHEGWFEK